MTERKMAMPGLKGIQGEVVIRLRVSLIILPHSGMGGFAPSPKKLSADSSIIMVPMSNTEVTKIGPRMLGRICSVSYTHLIIAFLHNKQTLEVLGKVLDFIIANGVHMLRIGKFGSGVLHNVELLPIIKMPCQQTHKSFQFFHTLPPQSIIFYRNRS